MNEDKSKKQLLIELKKLRQRVADLETQESKRQQVEEALRQSEEYSSTILNHSPNPMLVTNPDTSIRYVNPALEELTGYSLIEVIGQKAPYPWWTEETLEKIKGDFEEAFRHGAKSAEELLKKKSGERFWVEITATPVTVDGELKYYIASWMDITGHKQVEEALRLRAQLLNEATDSIIATDLDGNLIYMNEATCQTRGYSKEEMLHMNLKQLVPPHIASLVDKGLRHIKKEGAIVFDSEHLRKDDGVFPVETTARTVNLGDRTIILSVIRDITERKKAEEALRESEGKFSRAFHSNPHPMSIVTLDEGRYLDVNNSYVRTFGFSRKELTGRTTVEMGITKSNEVRMRMLQILEKTQEVKNLEVELYTKLGLKVDALLSASKIEIGGETCLLSVINDITGRKQAEEALRESEERYRALLELGERIGEAVVMLQDDERGAGMHVYASDEWSRITGYSKKELYNMSMFDLIHESDREKALERHERRILGEVLPGLYEITIVRKDGTEVPVEVTYAYSSYKGKPANVGYIRDISERKKMEEQLIVTDRLASIGELASGIAHELNNPLTGIIGFSELLLNKDIPEDVREDLQIINREAKRTSQVVKNLLTFAHKHETTKQLVDINKAVKSVLDLRAYEQKVNNIAIITNFDPGLPEITADSFRLQQVFVNIIINAEYFMVQSHGRGTLTITTERRGDAIRASFANDGPGIKKEHLRHLFDPFFTTKEVGKGTGLGLSICHGIVTEHGGQIHAESEPGKGATFIVELPIK